MRTGGKVALVVMVAGTMLAEPGYAQQPVAIVETIRSTTAGVEPMDYLEPGKVIRLGAGDRLVVSYLDSCARETILGGIVTIGTEQSTTQGGVIERSTVRCATSRIALNSAEAQRSGAFVSRALPARKNDPAGPAVSVPPGPVPFLYGLPLLLEVGPPGTLSLQRLDKSQKDAVVQLTARHMVGGRIVDFSKLPVKLAPGAIYKVRLGGRELVFAVDPKATAKDTSVISRLLRLPPA